MKSILHELGLKFGTDKAVPHDYLDIYDEYFSNRTSDVRTVLEFGVDKGASVRMWREYFPHAEIWGLDCVPIVIDEPRIHIVIGNEKDQSVLSRIAPGARLDFVVHDSSHYINDQIPTFEAIWPRVASGGIFVIEDLEVSYHWTGNDRKVMDAWIADKVNKMDFGIGDIRFIHFYRELLIFGKV
jgi:trans-aconitate methyltransferase